MIERDFPNLRITPYAQTSAVDIGYNCIAWAAGDKSREWWPEKYGYWPDGVPRARTLAAFVIAFGVIGYVECENGDLEPGFEKIAIYGLVSGPKHAARQLPSGMWSSKLGKNVDIAHELKGLEGARYGRVLKFLKRARPTTSPAVEPHENPKGKT